MKREKLVRDRIPEIIRDNGETCCIRTLSEEEYLSALDEKLIEELNEFVQGDGTTSHEIEELADLMEVIYAAAEVRGVSPSSLNRMRKEKAKKRGRFTQRIALQL